MYRNDQRRKKGDDMALRSETGNKEERREVVRKKELNDRCLFARMTWRPVNRVSAYEGFCDLAEANAADNYGMAEKNQLEFNQDFLNQVHSSCSKGEGHNTL